MVNQLKELEKQNGNIKFEAEQRTKEKELLTDSIRSQQIEFGMLKKKLHYFEKLCSKTSLELSPAQNANINRTLFYLGQVNDLLEDKYIADIGVNGKCSRQIIKSKSRKSIRSIRSNMFIKKICREIFQPIRVRYNEMFVRNLLLGDYARRMNNRQRRYQYTHHSKSVKSLKPAQTKQDVSTAIKDVSKAIKKNASVITIEVADKNKVNHVGECLQELYRFDDKQGAAPMMTSFLFRSNSREKSNEVATKVVNQSNFSCVF